MYPERVSLNLVHPVLWYIILAPGPLPCLANTIPIVQIDTIPVSNIMVRLMREAAWEENRPEIAGPHAAVLYFGPNNSPGRIHYGNAPEMAMWDMMVQKKESSRCVLNFAYNPSKRDAKALS